MDSNDRLFAEIALKLQLLTREQAAACRKQGKRRPQQRIAEIAVELGFMRSEEVALVRAQETRTAERQRRSVAPAALVEERMQRRDPRADSSPPPAAQVAGGARKRRDPRAWEAPAHPAEGQIRVPRPPAPFPPPRGDSEPISAPPRMSAPTAPRELQDTAPSVMPAPMAKADAGAQTNERFATPGLHLADTMPLTPPAALSKQRAGTVDHFPLAAKDERAKPSARTKTPAPSPIEPKSASTAGAGTLVQSFSKERTTGSTLIGAGPAVIAPPMSNAIEGAPFSSAAATLLQAHAVPAVAPMLESPPTQRPSKAKEQRPASHVALGESYLGRALALAQQQGASDLHVHSGVPLMVRVDGQLKPLSANTPLSADAAEKVIAEIMTDVQWAQLGKKGEVDFAFEIPALARFRANVYRQQRGLDAVFRIVVGKPPTLEQLGLPARLARLTDFRTGMVLCTGPAGSGKSTTLAALLYALSQTRADHLLTIEDPVEYVYPPGRALVNQRQVRDHTSSFSRALRAALREDPDVIAITELRDRETISLAISAAETGHLVLGTLHTGSAVQTIYRIINAFSADDQEQVRAMLAESLRAVVSQRLVPLASGRGRVPALELLMVTTAVSNLIRENKAHQLPSVMQTGKALGMVTLDDSLLELVRSGAVTAEAARRFATKKERFA